MDLSVLWTKQKRNGCHRSGGGVRERGDTQVHLIQMLTMGMGVGSRWGGGERYTCKGGRLGLGRSGCLGRSFPLVLSEYRSFLNGL